MGILDFVQSAIGGMGTENNSMTTNTDINVVIEHHNTGNDILNVTLNKDQIITVNSGSIISKDSSIELINTINAPANAPANPNANLNANGNYSDGQFGGAEIEGNMVTLKSNEDNVKTKISLPFTGCIKQIDIKPGDSYKIVKGGLLAYTSGITVDNSDYNLYNIYELDNDKEIIFTEIINNSNNSDKTEYIWITGFGAIEFNKESADAADAADAALASSTNKTVEIDIDNLLAIKTTGNYNISVEYKADKNKVYFKYTSSTEIYTHSKSGLTYYNNSKIALLKNIEALVANGTTFDYTIESLAPPQMPSSPLAPLAPMDNEEQKLQELQELQEQPMQPMQPMPPQQGGYGGGGGYKRKMFKNEKRQILDSMDPYKNLNNLIKFIG